MAVKTPRRVRARVGEQRSPGEVRPVSTRQIVGLGIGVVMLVVVATTALLWASSSTKTRTTSSSNLPHGGQTTYVGSYEETVIGSKRDQVAATLSLNCTTTCTDGSYTGYAGNFTLKVNGAQLTGSNHPSCEDESLLLVTDLSLAVPAQLPQSLTGTLTRTSTCTGTEPGPSVSLQLHRTR
jgi:hypothetical protein